MMPLQQRLAGHVRPNGGAAVVGGGVVPINNAWPAPAAVRADRNFLQPLPDDLPVDYNNPQAVDEEQDEIVAGAADELAMAKCCLPSGCVRLHEKTITLSDPGDAIKVICNNEACTVGKWMHGECFLEWEEHVLGYLRTCGRARSWSEKQRLQNLWTKKGYDLAFKACDCKCGKGHLKKDLDYFPRPKKADERRQKKQKKNKALVATPQGKTLVGGFSFQNLSSSENNNIIRAPLRVRTSSLCSTGSSPPSSDGTPPLTPGSGTAKSGTSSGAAGGRFDFFADAEQAAAGNIFWKRTDLSAFSCLPRHHRNPYHIKIEDEGPHGNDETRSFILTNLSAQKLTVVRCAVCQSDLPVYDKYPLIDGTFFLSPLQYTWSSIPISSERRRLHLNSICMRCLDGTKIALRCIGCKSQWSGAMLVIGTMYAYDIFAAMPCCSVRFTCKACRQSILDPGSAYQFFSEYSRQIFCPSCGVEDYHFVKPLQTTFQCVQACVARPPHRLF